MLQNLVANGIAQGLGNHGLNNQGFGNQGFGNQGMNNQGYNQGYNQGLNNAAPPKSNHMIDKGDQMLQGMGQITNWMTIIALVFIGLIMFSVGLWLLISPPVLDAHQTTGQPRTPLDMQRLEDENRRLQEQINAAKTGGAPPTGSGGSASQVFGQSSDAPPSPTTLRIVGGVLASMGGMCVIFAGVLFKFRNHPSLLRFQGARGTMDLLRGNEP
jgi:hypothetical protein